MVDSKIQNSNEVGQHFASSKSTAKANVYWVFFYISLVLAMFSTTIYIYSSKLSDAVENFYSLGVYKTFARGVAKFSSFFKFSLGEVLVILFAASVLLFLVLFVVKMIRNKKRRIATALRFLSVMIFSLSIILSWFSFATLPNYYRFEFANYSGLETAPASTEKLKMLCRELALAANEQRALLSQDANGVAILETDFRELAVNCNSAYENLLIENPEYSEILELSTIAVAKPVVLSTLMSYAHINGIYFPYTIEANVNVNSVDTDIPMSICHELAHISGFMREDEANFIGYIATRASDNAFVRYSGILAASAYARAALSRYNADASIEVYNLFSDDVKADIAADYENYKKYDTSFGNFSTAVNDTYLKLNNQSDGVESYGRTVDLLIADYNLRHSE